MVEREGERERWAGLGIKQAPSLRIIGDKVVQGLLSCLMGYGGGYLMVESREGGAVEGCCGLPAHLVAMKAYVAPRL